MTEIDGFTPAEWVDSDKVLKITEVAKDGSKSTSTFSDHKLIDRKTGDLKPAWPPEATKENSKLISPYEVIIKADREIIADGSNVATVEIEITADVKREVSIFIDGNEIETYEIETGDIVRESITTTSTKEEIEVEAIGEGRFRNETKIKVIQP